MIFLVLKFSKCLKKKSGSEIELFAREKRKKKKERLKPLKAQKP